VRVVIADDSVLLREGMARLLAEAGFEVSGSAGDAVGLLALVEATEPDIAIVDIKMPPAFTDEGIVAAHTIRADHPRVGVLVLSQYVDSGYAVQLVQGVPAGVGYLLKDRVSNVAVLVDALQRVHEGECVVDPTIVARLVGRPRTRDPLASLTDREREVLVLMAEGRTNRAIAEALVLSAKTVETHVSQIFMKLDLAPSADDHRRVLAVLALLRQLDDVPMSPPGHRPTDPG
jgi:DNA-binding NarL/FixJ family response regulator